MPPSQLKALKSSLREKGITGPQKSKKQKKQPKSQQSHQDRHATLQSIRDSFNPFEFRHGSSRPAKFPSASAKDVTKASGRYKEVLHRPGVSKSAGEEMRRQQLLPEMRRRNKVGGLVDRRIGEGDAGMTAEERAVQRFAREKAGKGGSLFDLEGSDDDAGGFGLTHGGRRIDELAEDDFGAGSDIEGSDDEDDGFLRRKRRRSDLEEEDEEAIAAGGAVDGEVQQPDYKKTKKEVMEEVIAKSKLHKYERQKAKEDDDDLRDELDAGMADMLALLRGHKAPNPAAQQQVEREAEAAMANGASEAGMNPERRAMLEGKTREQADKEYEKRLRQLAQDTRAKPSERSKTEEEKAQQAAERLKLQEKSRVKRMRGEDFSDDEEADAVNAGADDEDRGIDALGNEVLPDEAADFGFTTSAPQAKEADEQDDGNAVQPDEDEFDMDNGLIASDEDVELSDDEESDVSEASELEDGVAAPRPREDEEDDEFVKGILGDEAATSANAQELGTRSAPGAKDAKGLAYTYPCPRSHTELLEVVKDVPVEHLPTIVQRIRALHHPSLSASNKEGMADFSAALVGHIVYMADHDQNLAVTEQLIRHLHSLSRTYAIEIAIAFRRHLQAWHERPGSQPMKGDLIVLTAVGSMYPTSDHFHQVVTPAITMMARWLGLNPPDTEEKRRIGAFMVALAMKYQTLAKRYVPEAVRFTEKVLSAKALSAEAARPHLDNLMAMANLWKDKSAFIETFTPFLPLLKKLGAKKEHQHLRILLQSSRLRRRPLELHHHKKLPIRTSVPRFEEGFNPDKHYDPDRERSEAAKLKKEFKREKKGALRELRKDANFIGREQLREKRERDAEHEKRERRLIAEIQGEEGHESKAYDRERAKRAREKKSKK